MIRIIAVLLVISSILAFTACSNQDNTPTEITQPSETIATEPNKKTEPTAAPTGPADPTETATVPTEPTNAPTESETNEATAAPTQNPTQAATSTPTQKPTQAPTQAATQTATAAPTQKPTQAPTAAPTQAPTQKPTETPSQTTISETQARSIAKDLISGYLQYSHLGICCNLEYDETDMSAYLTQSQKENYWNWQYKITCCHSIEDVKEHILEIMDTSVARKFTVENLFSDGEGNIYLLVNPMGAAGYGEISIVEYSADRIVADAPIEDIDGYLGINDRFIIEKIGNKYLITDIS